MTAPVVTMISLACVLLVTVAMCYEGVVGDVVTIMPQDGCQGDSMTQSGYYQLNQDTVYCDMQLECGGNKGGWTRVVSLNTSTGDDCPTGWSNNYSSQRGHHYCTGGMDAGCYSINVSTYQLSYRRVCGRLNGYQRGSMNAFYSSGYTLGTATGYTPEAASSSINGAYVDGVSITMGVPRKHIWTYAVGLSDNYRYNYTRGGYNCPCAENPGPDPPTFVQEHYHCESGNSGRYTAGREYSEDMLWDGDGCGVKNNCCAQPGLPWFFRQFSVPVTGDIEVRICRDQNRSDEEVLVEQLYLYIQ